VRWAVRAILGGAVGRDTGPVPDGGQVPGLGEQRRSAGRSARETRKAIFVVVGCPGGGEPVAAHDPRDRLGSLVLVRIPGVGHVPERCVRVVDRREEIIVAVGASFRDPVTQDLGRQAAACVVGPGAEDRAVKLQLIEGTDRIVRTICDRTVRIRVLDQFITIVVSDTNCVCLAGDGQRFRRLAPDWVESVTDRVGVAAVDSGEHAAGAVEGERVAVGDGA